LFHQHDVVTVKIQPSSGLHAGRATSYNNDTAAFPGLGKGQEFEA
jgi:hypothetical protein